MAHVAMTADARFEDLYCAHGRAVHAYCMRRVAREEAKDATSDVFLAAWRRIDDVPPGDGQLPWLLGVARHVLLNRSRSERRRFRLATKASGDARSNAPSPEVQVVRQERHRELITAIGRLPRRDQEILRLVEWDGLTRDQVAAMFSLGRSAIDKRITRAYKKLERLLGAGEGAGGSDQHTTPSHVEEGGE